MNKVYTIAQGVKARNEEFGLLIVSNLSPAISINHDAKAVWELINGTNTVFKIIEILKLKYQTDNIESGVKEVLTAFLKIRVIQEVL